jgi:DNA-directed RNA polymerase subunit RPC12/RpoP
MRPRAAGYMGPECPECDTWTGTVHITDAFEDWPGTNLGTVYECSNCKAQWLLGDMYALNEMQKEGKRCPNTSTPTA